MNKSKGGQGGMGFFGTLQVAFILLKVMGHLEHWSWWHVFIPTWVSIGIAIAAVALFVWMDTKARGISR